MRTLLACRPLQLACCLLTLVLLGQAASQDDKQASTLLAANEPAATKPAAAKRTDKKLTADKPANDWPLFRGNRLAQGVASSSLPKAPKLLWEYKVKEGAFEATPAVVAGVVYIGDLDGSLFALKLENGHKIWEYKIDSGFIASPAYHQERIFVGDYDGRFFCVDAKTGKKAWVFETQAEIASSANFYKDMVLVGSQDATLYCLKISDGSLVWKHSIADQIRCSPTIVANRCFLAGCDGKLQNGTACTRSHVCANCGDSGHKFSACSEPEGG